MKKKILSFLLVLASVIACAVCFAACNNSLGEIPDEYVGKYKCLSVHIEVKMQDIEEKFDLIPGQNGTPENYYTLELNADGKYVMTMNIGQPEPIIMNGTWGVRNEQLELRSADGSGSFTNSTLVDGFLTLHSKNEVQEQTIKFEKIAE